MRGGGVNLVQVYDQPIALTTANVTHVTGLALAQGAGQFLEFECSDTGGTARAWTIGKIRVDKMVERFLSGDAVDAYIHVYDNDYVVANIVDLATGALNLRYAGRAVGITRIELYEVPPLGGT